MRYFIPQFCTHHYSYNHIQQTDNYVSRIHVRNLLPTWRRTVLKSDNNKEPAQEVQSMWKGKGLGVRNRQRITYPCQYPTSHQYSFYRRSWMTSRPKYKRDRRDWNIHTTPSGQQICYLYKAMTEQQRLENQGTGPTAEMPCPSQAPVSPALRSWSNGVCSFFNKTSPLGNKWTILFLVSIRTFHNLKASTILNSL